VGELSRNDESTDEQLVERSVSVAGGDVRAFELLVRRHQERILANCRYLTGSSVDAEDLAQEVFVKAFFGLRRFEGRSKFSTWLQRIKINHCLNFNQKQRNKSFVSIESPEVESRVDLQTSPRAEQNLSAADERRRIAATLDEMSESLRVSLILRDADGLSYAEIAEELDLSLSAVKMRIKRGREEFRRVYDSGFGEGQDKP
jgi:RNA polymerase sigma-70 factor (ECF subfamily)